MQQDIAAFYASTQADKSPSQVHTHVAAVQALLGTTDKLDFDEPATNAALHRVLTEAKEGSASRAADMLLTVLATTDCFTTRVRNPLCFPQVDVRQVASGANSLELVAAVAALVAIAVLTA